MTCPNVWGLTGSKEEDGRHATGPFPWACPCGCSKHHGLEQVDATRLSQQKQVPHLVELVVVVLVLGDLVEELDALLDQVLLDDLEDLVLLQHLARDVEGQILAVHDALHEGQPLGDELLAVVHDEHPPHVQLDVVALLPARTVVPRNVSTDFMLRRPPHRSGDLAAGPLNEGFADTWRTIMYVTSLTSGHIQSVLSACIWKGFTAVSRLFSSTLEQFLRTPC